MKLSPVFIVTAVLSFAPALALAQDQNHEAAAPAAQAQTHDHAAMVAAEKAKADAELDQKLAKLDKVKGDAKVALMADILKQLVAEHRANAASHQAAAPASAGHSMSCPMCAAKHGDGSKH